MKNLEKETRPRVCYIKVKEKRFYSLAILKIEGNEFFVERCSSHLMISGIT